MYDGNNQQFYGIVIKESIESFRVKCEADGPNYYVPVSLTSADPDAGSLDTRLL